MSKKVATLAGGCFWCTEAIFQRLKGVIGVVSGYTGGRVENPTYEQVCTGKTSHAEAIQISFDPKALSYKDLVYVFFKTHDPTTLNRQGNDVGEQYRSVIFYHNEEQKRVAEEVKEELEKAKVYSDSIVTKIEPFTNFYKAERYHQNYYNRNTQVSYCQAVIDPKIQKLFQDFPEKLKEEVSS